MNELEELQALLDGILDALQLALSEGEDIPDDVQGMLANEIGFLSDRIETLRAEQQGPEQPPAGPNPPPVNQGLGDAPSPSAQLLWILAGQQEQPFISYLREFPSPETQALLNNPAELARTINFLSQMMPQGVPPTVDGIQKAPLNSSNVWGFKYDPKDGNLTVRFQGGSEYQYAGVPPQIYRAFQKGNASARTNGRNNYGVWWQGKNPSLGAALNQYIKAGGFPYQRIR